MRKKLIILSIFVSLIFLGVQSFAQQDELKAFVDSINNVWKLKNHDEILQKIQSRLDNDEGDILALSIAQYYYVFAECDLEKAREFADKFYNSVQKLGKPNLTLLAFDMKNEIYDIPLGESGAYTNEQLNQIYDCFPDSFPFIERCYSLTEKLIK